MDIGDPLNFLPSLRPTKNQQQQQHRVQEIQNRSQQQKHQTKNQVVHQQVRQQPSVQTEQPVVAPVKPLTELPHHAINITHNNTTQCGTSDATETKPKKLARKRKISDSDLVTATTTDEDTESETDDDYDMEFNLADLLPKPIMKQMKTTHPTGVKAIKRLIAKNKNYKRQQRRRRSFSRHSSNQMQQSYINQVRRPTTNYNIPNSPRRQPLYARMFKMLSWPTMCLIGAYVGHNHYSQNIAPMFGQLMSTIATMSANYWIPTSQLTI